MKNLSLVPVANDQSKSVSVPSLSVLVVSENQSTRVARDAQTLFSLGVDVASIDLVYFAKNDNEKPQNANEISQALFEQQWHDSFSKNDISMVKIGFLMSQAKIDFVVKELSRFHVPVIFDLVLPPEVCISVLNEALFEQYRRLLAPLSTIVISDAIDASIVFGSDVLLESSTTLLAAFPHSDHLLLLGSRDFAHLPPRYNLKCFGYTHTLAINIGDDDDFFR